MKDTNHPIDWVCQPFREKEQRQTRKLHPLQPGLGDGAAEGASAPAAAPPDAGRDRAHLESNVSAQQTTYLINQR